MFQSQALKRLGLVSLVGLFWVTFQLLSLPELGLRQERVPRPIPPLPSPLRPFPVCVPVFPARKINRIVFHHVRKAGGSTIGGYLEEVTEKYNLRYDHVEGDTVEVDDPNTLFITNMRDPVSRTISNYKYDQRWRCGQLMHNKSFVPTLDNIRQTLDQFVAKDTSLSTSGKPPKNPNHPLWHCANNCHTRWYSGDFFNLSAESAIKAREKLYKYNLIIHTDRLADPDYVRRIEGLFNHTGLVPRGMYCGKASKNANKKVPLVISNQTRAHVVAANEFDIPLHQEMTNCEHGRNFSAFESRFF